uniref:glycosyltransferase family 2 protein n=1 Tax=Algoriphagus sp. TaxID=1872435 RepID=UPI004048037B
MLKNIPRISVIVPIYNVASFLSKCIESILEQSFADFELILVNDGSPDSSHDICLSYQEKDKRITIINKPNGGLLSARKAGLESARADFISFVDGDDWVDIDFLASMYRIVELHNVDLVISGFIRAFEGRNEKIEPFYKQGIYRENRFTELLNNMLNTSTFFQHGVSTYVWNKLFKREILKKILFLVPNEITMGEDAAITYSYLPHCSSIGITNSCNYFYRQRVNSMVKSIQSSELERDHLTNLIHYLNGAILKKLEKTKLRRDLLYYLYSQALVRFGGLISVEDIYIPFQGLKKNDKVLVYSSGTFGQRLVSFNNIYNVFELSSWIDLDHIESNDLGLEVDSPFFNMGKEYDSIVIASIDGSKIEHILNFLSFYGFDCSKYRPLNLDEGFVTSYLSYIGFNFKFLNE